MAPVSKPVIISKRGGAGCLAAGNGRRRGVYETVCVHPAGVEPRAARGEMPHLSGFRRYSQDVYLYIRRLSGSEQVAEEITGETFFKALRSIDRFCGECDIRVWLCQIAKNSYYTYREKAGRHAGLEEAGLGDLPDAQGSLDERLADGEMAAQARRHLHELPEPYREVFMWRVFADLSFRQIGQIFHKTDNWACVTFHRARGMLRSRLEESDCEK